MSGEVVQLLANNALCVDQVDLAARVRQMADRIEAGEFGALERVIFLLDRPDGIERRVYGRQCNAAELVGLLEWAKHRVITPLSED